MLGTWNYEEKSSLTPWKHVSIRLGITIIYWWSVWKMERHWKKDQKVKAGHGSSPKRPPSWPVSTENIEGHPQSKHVLFPAKMETKKYPGPSKWFKMLGYAPPKCRVLTIFCAGKVTVTNSCSYGPTNTYKWDELTPITEIIYDYMSL